MAVPLYHLVFRAYRFATPLSSLPLAPMLWRGLRQAFPDALAATLMPDHGHVIAPSASADEARVTLSKVLSGVRRSEHGTLLRWAELALPREIQDRKHLRRQIRYVALNPARGGLVRDPLAWPWSTHRDLVGAVVDPWLTPERLAAALREPPLGFAPRFHTYVSSDPTVAVIGTPFPQPAEPSATPHIGLGSIVRAACAAERAPLVAVQRRGRARDGFLDLARDCGWRDLRALTQVTGVARTTIWRRADRRLEAPPAAWLCLGDERLTDILVPTGCNQMLR